MNVPFRARGEEGDAGLVVQGIPFDLGTTNRPGTRFGPDAIRVASRILQWEPRRWPWDFNFSEHLGVVDVGDIEFPYGHIQGMAETTTRATEQLLRAGHRVLAAVAPLLAARCEAVLAGAQEDGGESPGRSNYAPALAILSARHETQYSRLFRS